MAKFVLTYRGGKMAETPADQEAAMAKWGAWFGTLGSAVSDMGAPFGESTTVGDESGTRLSGYSIVDVDSLASAKDVASRCPIVADGGSIDVYETIAM
ncbi:MAG TPA: hypothetical protein VG368_00060 [Acidimicrobiales bacterium]|jgi:hypothetical protein|nr:hypothetical protein [Acidimicrobiales bacterium]